MTAKEKKKKRKRENLCVRISYFDHDFLMVLQPLHINSKIQLQNFIRFPYCLLSYIYPYRVSIV